MGLPDSTSANPFAELYTILPLRTMSATKPGNSSFLMDSSNMASNFFNRSGEIPTLWGVASERGRDFLIEGVWANKLELTKKQSKNGKIDLGLIFIGTGLKMKF
jgi:hypothetical protein